jgi:hypothetical protein
MQCQGHEIQFCQRFEVFQKRTLFGSCGFFVSAHKIIRPVDGRFDFRWQAAGPGISRDRP